MHGISIHNGIATEVKLPQEERFEEKAVLT